MGLRTDIEHSVRLALQSAGKEYYGHLSSMLDDARRLGLVCGGAVDLSLDHWHIPYWGEKLMERYGYHYNGMMNRSFPGIHPLTAYDLTDGCFILITPPPSEANPSDVAGLEGLSLCERLGFEVGSVRGDRGLSTIEFVRGLSPEGEGKTTYYLGVKANSILRRHVRGRGWVEDEETGERACLRRDLDYHGVKTNLIALSKKDRKHPSKKRTYLFITNDCSSTDPFALLRQYRMRGEHERCLGCLSALGVKHLPSTDSRDEIAGHLLLFTKLQFLMKLFCKKFGIEGCEPKTLVNLLLRRSGISWTDDQGRRRTIIFGNRAAIKKIGKTTLRFDDGQEVILLEQWRGHPRPRVQ